MQKRTMLGYVYILSELIKKGLLQKDPQNSNNILVYREASINNPEGWYSDNIISVATEVFQSENQQKDLLEQAIKAGIDTEKCFENANNLLT